MSTITAPAPTARVSAGTVPFAAAGLLFVAYPVLRPWADQAPEGMPEAFASPAWLAGHLAAAAGFLLVGLGLLALRDRLGTATARAALVVWWTGAAMTLTYYGAETFALNALSDRPDLPAMAEAIRMGPTQVAVFGVGLVLLAVAGVLTALALRPGWVGVPFALGMVLFLPQFFTGPELRIAHGVLLGAGCLLIAVRAARTHR
ncbi:hypothetical protein [Pseudonocardia lacus]|uniref:hypothetical protein n=1 Tax=Pseudonocardia lacus TaxID=2835865 RepID=UPI001BDBFA98|nr:hypothetical protein [Pseudonocardia lacus]